YTFRPDLPGTYYYHSHAEFQRADGIFGNLIIRQPKERERNSHLYDYDLPEHEIIVFDWLEDLSMNLFLKHHHSNGGNKPSNILINGRGLEPKFYAIYEVRRKQITETYYFLRENLSVLINIF